MGIVPDLDIALGRAALNERMKAEVRKDNDVAVASEGKDHLVAGKDGRSVVIVPQPQHQLIKLIEHVGVVAGELGPVQIDGFVGFDHSQPGKFVSESLSTSESGFDLMPPFDTGFAFFPAQIDYFSIAEVREVAKTALEILDLDAQTQDLLSHSEEAGDGGGVLNPVRSSSAEDGLFCRSLGLGRKLSKSFFQAVQTSHEAA